MRVLLWVACSLFLACVGGELAGQQVSDPLHLGSPASSDPAQAGRQAADLENLGGWVLAGIVAVPVTLYVLTAESWGGKAIRGGGFGLAGGLALHHFEKEKGHWLDEQTASMDPDAGEVFRRVYKKRRNERRMKWFLVGGAVGATAIFSLILASGSEL